MVQQAGQFGRLPAHADALREANPASHARLSIKDRLASSPNGLWQLLAFPTFMSPPNSVPKGRSFAKPCRDLSSEQSNPVSSPTWLCRVWVDQILSGFAHFLALGFVRAILLWRLILPEIAWILKSSPLGSSCSSEEGGEPRPNHHWSGVPKKYLAVAFCVL